MTITHLQQPDDSRTCGQHCIAMAAGVSVALVINALGKKGGTRTVDIVRGLRAFGFRPLTDKLVRWDGVSKPPAYAILHARFGDPKGKFYGHWVLNYDGVIHDPEMVRPGVYSGGHNHRFTAYLEFEPRRA